MQRRKVIAVIGDGKVDPKGDEYNLAFEVGRLLVDAGYRVQSGGLGGVMSAAFEGARSSSHYKEGDTIAIVPSFDRESATEFADIVIPTGLDIMRNAIVVNADAVVAIGGGAGTLSEIALAWSLFKLIVAYKGVGGWAANLADQKIDARVRYEDIADDRVYGADSAQQMLSIINTNIARYTRVHRGIVQAK